MRASSVWCALALAGSLSTLVGSGDEPTDEDERADLTERWEAALLYLEECEEAARDAEDEAREAVTLAESGDWDGAIEAAERACDFEERYGDCPTWRPLRKACEALVEMAD